MLLYIYAKGVHFGMVGNVGSIHKSPFKDKNSAMKAELEKLKRAQKIAGDILDLWGDSYARWANSFDWGFGMYLGYRWDLPKQWFLDWNFLDFTHGFSITTFRVGKVLTDRISVYGVVTPCALMVTDGILNGLKLWSKKSAIQSATTPERLTFAKEASEDFGYRLPFIGLGANLGAGVNYRISPRVSLVGQWTFQMSYLDAADRTLSILSKSKHSKDLEIPRKIYSNSIAAIRQRFSVGVEFHGMNH